MKSPGGSLKESRMKARRRISVFYDEGCFLLCQAMRNAYVQSCPRIGICHFFSAFRKTMVGSVIFEIICAHNTLSMQRNRHIIPVSILSQCNKIDMWMWWSVVMYTWVECKEGGESERCSHHGQRPSTFDAVGGLPLTGRVLAQGIKYL